jgi:hypothetical protein
VWRASWPKRAYGTFLAYLGRTPGNVIIGSGRTGASRPTNRYTRFIHRDWHVGHGLDPNSTGAPTATQPADMPRRDGAKPG